MSSVLNFKNKPVKGNCPQLKSKNTTEDYRYDCRLQEK